MLRCVCFVFSKWQLISRSHSQSPDSSCSWLGYTGACRPHILLPLWLSTRISYSSHAKSWSVCNTSLSGFRRWNNLASMGTTKQMYAMLFIAYEISSLSIDSAAVLFHGIRNSLRSSTFAEHFTPPIFSSSVSLHPRDLSAVSLIAGSGSTKGRRPYMEDMSFIYPNINITPTNRCTFYAQLI